MMSDDPQWVDAKEKAGKENIWFIPEFIELASRHIAGFFLQGTILNEWSDHYGLHSTTDKPVDVGIVMAGNIPLVGFHDLLCVFISGHRAVIKPSSKDETLIRHLAEKLMDWDPETKKAIRFSDRLKGCHAYIATGSNNSAGYFEYYFNKYPHIIRRNRTSVAILTGNETKEELQGLADDVCLYFGLGCRNVTKIYIPENYDFLPLLDSFKKYAYLSDFRKYRNNYEYNLAIQILNKKFYMTEGSILLVEEPSLFSPIAQLHYEMYTDMPVLVQMVKNNDDVQSIIGRNFIPFGKSQFPAVNDYADGVDTLGFLSRL
jgi:hypothetical protein